MKIEAIYGESCPTGVFSITPSGSCPPWTLAPEWLLAKALAHDCNVRNPGRLTYLLKMTPEPHNIWKAVAIEPDDWWSILGTAVYTGSPSDCREIQLLPMAPSVSTLSAIGKKEACIFAENLDPDFLKALVHALGSLGTQRLILVNPQNYFGWHTARVKGIHGYNYARRLGLPRALQLRALTEAKVNIDAGEAITETSEVFQPLIHTFTPDLLRLAFGDESEIAFSLLSEVEASGGIMSYRALLDMAATLAPNAKIIVRKLILFGYLYFRQAQTEITTKGILVISK